MNDREILDSLRRGDQAAFDSLFRTYYPPLVGVAEHILRSRSIAEDVVQDVFLELWRRRVDLVIQESFRSYLFRAARNRALNHSRHERVERRGEPDAAGPAFTPATATEALVQGEIDTALHDAVTSLPARCREVFELSRVHGLRHSEIADVLGISVKTVEAQITKALRILRTRLAPWLA